MSGTGSASASGALKVKAAITPDAAASAVAPLFVLTRAPFRIAC
jgi:hypothetical protein